MIDIQVRTLEEIDSKAARLIGFLGVLLGLLVTVGRIVPATEHAGQLVDLTSVAGLIVLGVGVFSLLLSLVYATITYLSSEFEYGLDAAIAHDFATIDTIPTEVYYFVVLRCYAEAITANEPIVAQNARRFRYALSSLVGGIIALSLSAGYYVIGLPPRIEAITLVLAAIPVGSLCLYIRDEGYLTPESVRSTEETTDGS